MKDVSICSSTNGKYLQVYGTQREDKELHTLLKEAKFRWCPKNKRWWSYNDPRKAMMITKIIMGTVSE